MQPQMNLTLCKQLNELNSAQTTTGKPSLSTLRTALMKCANHLPSHQDNK